MGKTYRFDPHSGKRSNKHSHRGENFATLELESLEGLDWKGGGIDAEWAIEKMATRVSCVVDALVKEGLICEGEREDYKAKYNEQLIKFAGKYDPTRKGKTGKSASPLHYLRIVEAGLTSNIRDYARFRRDHIRVRPLVQTVEEAKEVPLAICVSDVKLADGCKSVKMLELRMDVRTLCDMLTGEEKICLALRIEGCTQEEVARAISERTGNVCDRDHVRKVVIPHIQRKARKCGFYPPSERRG